MGRAFEYRKASKMARWDKMAKTFSKIGKDIALAVKAGGPDPDSNPALRRCVQNAKGANMPKDNVERAIKKASGADAEQYEEFTYEGYGQGGVAFFVLTCLLILLTNNIESFLALRFLQGFGLSVISAAGYAAIQETFEERDAIKVMAIMANISLLAPLIGPVVGAFLIDHVSWHWGFIGIAFLAFLSWFGLKAKMPSQQVSIPKRPLSYIFDDYKKVFKNKTFLGLTLGMPMVAMPLMLWIALSPVILVEELGLSSMQYGLAQFPVLGGLIVGNLVLIKIVDRMALGKTVLIGLPLMFVGTAIIVLGAFWREYFVHCVILGMTLVSFGEGISFSVLYRFALMSSEVSKGTVAASISILLMTIFFTVIEIVRVLYEYFHLWAYASICFALIALWFTFPRHVLKKLIQERKEKGEF